MDGIESIQTTYGALPEAANNNATTEDNMMPAMEAAATQPTAATADAINMGQSVQPGGELGKDEFLNLLMTQLSNQDPMDPMDSTESIAQLAQFSALEQMQNVSAQIQKQRHSSALLDSMLLQGQAVEIGLQTGEVATGVIENAFWSNDEMNLQINGRTIPMSEIDSMKLMIATEEDSTGTGTTGIADPGLTDIAESGGDTAIAGAVAETISTL